MNERICEKALSRVVKEIIKRTGLIAWRDNTRIGLFAILKMFSIR